MNVIDVARQAGVSPHAVRYYSRRGLLKPEKNPRNGYKQFSPRDVNKLRFIRCTQTLGFPLLEIEKMIMAADQGESPCPKVRQLLQERIAANHQRVAELVAMQERMEDALSQWQALPDSQPTGDSICCLIEAFGNQQNVDDVERG